MMSHENYDPCFPDQPVVDLYIPVWANLPAFRSKPAFIWANDAGPTSYSSLTYGELNSSIHIISCKLLSSLKKTDTVVVLCSPGLELVEIIFGCQRAGLLSVPIVPPHPSFSNENYHHLIRVLSQTNPKAAIAHSSYIAKVQKYLSSPSHNKRLAELLKGLHWIPTDALKRAEPKDLKLVKSGGSYDGCKADEVYLIQYTSGATAIPKPVLVTAGSAAHNVRVARKAYDLHPQSMIVSWLPQYHDCGLMFLLLTVVSGATSVLTSPTTFVTRPRIWLELITEFRATCTPVPSFALPLAVKRGGVNEGMSSINLSGMKNLIIINEPIYKASIDEFLVWFTPFGLNPSSISPSYGLAENCTFVSTAWRASFPDGLPSHKKLLPSARLANSYAQDYEEEEIDIMVVDEESHEPVEDGVEGEIWVSSPSNASGYLGHPSLTREVFHGRLRNRVGRCFVRTGDRGVVIGEERYLYVMGRSSDIIRTEKGQEIHPHYIETSAYNCSSNLLRGGCLAAFKIGRTIALVAEMRRHESDVSVLRRLCENIREVLEQEKVEIDLVVLVKSGSVPKTTSGKIQRWAAKSYLMEGKMRIIMKMEFGIYGNVSSSSMPRIGSDDKRGAVDGEKKAVLSFASNAQARPSLLSLL
ncbi:AMP-dependent synthetase/ligase [Dillenia turbinata]|uniref:AMP-dependent synthetase/ligase n=1 Tax=Dillenia turbinata TaxID=194707 RepID=A0AAN8W2N3_9MAGN